MIRIGFGMNACLVSLWLLLYAVDKNQKYAWSSLACGSVWSFCALYLLFDRYRRSAMLLPGDASWAGASPRHRPSAHIALMALLAVLGIAHPSLFQGLLLHMQRVLFNVASLNPLEAAVLHVIASGGRLSACLWDNQQEGHDGDCGEAIITEVCFSLGSIFATYAAREMFKSSMSLVDARGSTVKTTSHDSSEEAPAKDASIAADSKAVALGSILQATCDAVVFLDARRRIAKPAAALAMMLGFEGSLFNASLEALMPGEDPETDVLLSALEALESTPSSGLAATTRISMINAEGALVRMHCAYAALADRDGKPPAGYILGMQELVGDRATGMRPLRSQASQASAAATHSGSLAPGKCGERMASGNTSGVTRLPSSTGRTTMYGRSREETFHPVGPILGPALSRTGSRARRSESSVMTAHQRVMRGQTSPAFMSTTVGTPGMARPWHQGVPRFDSASSLARASVPSSLQQQSERVRFAQRTITMEEVLQQTRAALEADVVEGLGEPCTRPL